jgi:hypothetical protein
MTQVPARGWWMRRDFCEGRVWTALNAFIPAHPRYPAVLAKSQPITVVSCSKRRHLAASVPGLGAFEDFRSASAGLTTLPGVRVRRERHATARPDLPRVPETFFSLR